MDFNSMVAFERAMRRFEHLHLGKKVSLFNQFIVFNQLYNEEKRKELEMELKENAKALDGYKKKVQSSEEA